MIRKAKLEDLNIITEYNHNLALETENLKLDKSILKKGVEAVLLDENKGVYYLYEINKQIVGQLLITYEWSDWRNANFYWIQSVYVNKDYRSQGIFKALYKFVKEKASLNNVCGLKLYVEMDNKNAQATYRSLGMLPSSYSIYESLN